MVTTKPPPEGRATNASNVSRKTTIYRLPDRREELGYRDADQDYSARFAAPVPVPRAFPPGRESHLRIRALRQIENPARAHTWRERVPFFPASSHPAGAHCVPAFRDPR